MKSGTRPDAPPTPAARLRAQWRALSSRQRGLAAGAVALLVAALAWWVALRPALSTLRQAPSQRQALDAQVQRLRQLEAQALAMRSTLQALPPLGQGEAQRVLEASVRQHFGEAAGLTVQAEGATLTLTGVSGAALAQWLAQARIEARTLPTGARLNRQAAGLWEGQMTLALPPAAAR